MYIMDKTTATIVHGVTSGGKFTRRNPNLSHLTVFGCIAYVHILYEKRTKLDPKVRTASSLLTLYIKKGIDVITLQLDQ